MHSGKVTIGFPWQQLWKVSTICSTSGINKRYFTHFHWISDTLTGEYDSTKCISSEIWQSCPGQPKYREENSSGKLMIEWAAELFAFMLFWATQHRAPVPCATGYQQAQRCWGFRGCFTMAIANAQRIQVGLKYYGEPFVALKGIMNIRSKLKSLRLSSKNKNISVSSHRHRAGPRLSGPRLMETFKRNIKHTVAHTIVLCMHQKRFIPSVISPMRNLWRGVNFFSINYCQNLQFNWQFKFQWQNSKDNILWKCARARANPWPGMFIYLECGYGIMLHLALGTATIMAHHNKI